MAVALDQIFLQTESSEKTAKIKEGIKYRPKLQKEEQYCFIEEKRFSKCWIRLKAQKLIPPRFFFCV